MAPRCPIRGLQPREDERLRLLKDAKKSPDDYHNSAAKFIKRSKVYVFPYVLQKEDFWIHMDNAKVGRERFEPTTYGDISRNSPFFMFMFHH
jgi:hypothetical protein